MKKEIKDAIDSEKSGFKMLFGVNWKYKKSDQPQLRLYNLNMKDIWMLLLPKIVAQFNNLKI